MTKRSRARAVNDPSVQPSNHFALRKISPLTTNQSKFFEAYDNDMNIMAEGYAGTGKTYIALYKALKQVLTNGSGYDRVVIIRSVVQGRDMGFLPGGTKDKSKPFESPYKEICDDLFGRGDGYDILKLKKIIDFSTTSFLRGITFNNAIVIVDETQNMTFQELDTVMTRIGNHSRIVFCGDYRQTDLTKHGDLSGIKHLMAITKRIKSFMNIEFGKDDIVRSGLVKEYIIQKTELADA